METYRRHAVRVEAKNSRSANALLKMIAACHPLPLLVELKCQATEICPYMYMRAHCDKPSMSVAAVGRVIHDRVQCSLMGLQCNDQRLRHY